MSSKLNMITLLLVIVGALNWGLAICGVNLVNLILGSIPVLENIVYALVAISGVYQVKNLMK